MEKVEEWIDRIRKNELDEQYFGREFEDYFHKSIDKYFYDESTNNEVPKYKYNMIFNFPTDTELGNILYICSNKYGKEEQLNDRISQSRAYTLFKYYDEFINEKRKDSPSIQNIKFQDIFARNIDFLYCFKIEEGRDTILYSRKKRTTNHSFEEFNREDGRQLSTLFQNMDINKESVSYSSFKSFIEYIVSDKIVSDKNYDFAEWMGAKLRDNKDLKMEIEKSKAPILIICNLAVSKFQQLGTLLIESYNEIGDIDIDNHIKNYKEQFYSLKLAEFRVLSEFNYQRIRRESIKSAVAAIMSRNMSHNLGSHVISGTKNYLMNKDYDLSSADNRGMHRLLQYLQERMDFISVIINTLSDGYRFGATLNLKTDILDEIAADGRDKRHNQGEHKKQTKSFLLDYIIRSEDIIRDDVENKMKLELMLLLEKEKNEVVIHAEEDKSIKDATSAIMSRNMSHNLGYNMIRNRNNDIYNIDNPGTIIYSFSSEANGDNNASEFNSIEFSVPFGINSRHAFLTIIENYMRNSAKYNKNAVSNKTLLISILIKEKDNDTYTITIFDNKEKVNDELFNGKRCLETDIQILEEEDDSLNTKNKGIKEMLICSAWLQGKYDNWSIIESKSQKNQELLSYEQIPLSKITQGIENSIEEEPDDTRKEEKRKRLAYYNKNDTALGIQFDLPKHKYIYYAKIKDVNDIYTELPSADFYLIELDEIVNEQKVKYTLPNVILVNVQSDNNIHYIFTKDKDCNQNNKLIKTITVEGDITAGEAINRAINNKSILLECYKFKYNYEDRRILINYLINSNKYRDDVVNVIRAEGKIDNSYLRNDSKVYIFSRHNDTPSIFTKFYEKSKKLYPDHRFLEGISGASYNYNLLINAPIQELEFYKIIRSCDTKIAIIDERIYDKYRKLKFPDNVSNDINITEFNNDIENIRKLEGSAVDLSDDCYNFLYKYVGGDLRKRHERIEEFLRGQKAIDITQSYNRPYTEEKGIYIYNYDFENNCLVNLDGTCLQKINSDVEFLSIHYGILDKYKKSVDEKNILMGDKFDMFVKEVVDDDKLSNTRIILHSGRGGVVKIADYVTFVPLSSIESCMDDCKYKLAQLFFNLKYKKETGL